jgi:hypothetical protein
MEMDDESVKWCLENGLLPVLDENPSSLYIEDFNQISSFFQ